MIDTAASTVEPTVIMVGTNPVRVAITPDGKHAYVTNFSSNNVSVIDMASKTVAATVAVEHPQGVAVTRDGKHAYVTSGGSNTVSVIDTATNAWRRPRSRGY